jgi:hypothetical protein
MPGKVLQSMIDEEEIVYKPQFDLMCFVRSFYLMFLMNRIPFDKNDDNKKRTQTLLNSGVIVESQSYGTESMKQ